MREDFGGREFDQRYRDAVGLLSPRAEGRDAGDGVDDSCTAAADPADGSRDAEMRDGVQTKQLPISR
jgi:hypothetical protein